MPRQRMTGSYVFVAIVFLVLAAGFVASTGMLIYEFRETDWLTLLVADSHLYLFFPTFGLLALMAFYLPAVVFTHLYWNHLRLGPLRLALGFLVALGLTGLVNTFMLGADSLPRAIWEISPRALQIDKGTPENCHGTATGCARGPAMTVVQDVRRVAQERVGITAFARTCVPDPLLELPAGHDQKRWCAPSGVMMTAAECCVAQARFRNFVAEQARGAQTRSQLADLDQLFQAMKIFFVIVLLFVGAMLAYWRERIEALYAPLAPRIERHVLIGGFAMVLWPIMDYAAFDTMSVMYGKWLGSVPMRLSLVIAPWALLLLFYFLRRLRQNLELTGQMAGVAVSALAIFLRQEIKDIGVRLFGVGIDVGVGAVLAILWLAGFVLLFYPRGTWRSSPTKKA
jgi:hypothetical protein